MPQLQIVEQDWSSTTAQVQCGMEPRLTSILGGILPFMYSLRFELKKRFALKLAVHIYRFSEWFYNIFYMIEYYGISFNGILELA